MIDASIYGIVALSRVAFQIGTSMLERREQYDEIEYPKATLVIACYNEPARLFERALQSFANQTYKDLEVIVVDDGSKNAGSIRRITKKYGFTYIYQKNAGKREAMFTAFKHMSKDSQVVLTADSDTLWHPNASKELVKVLLSDESIGAVTGEVAVLNEKENFLTQLIAIRYHIAFQHERASQSYFNKVTCVSGPLGAYRREIINQVKYRFINQFFFGKKCTYGDDRHLTNLVLDMGYDVKYAQNALCHTYAPAQFSKLVKQQTRWSKSYWREIVWQLRVIPKHGIYMAYDWTISFILPFLLTFAVAGHILHISNGSLQHLVLLPLTIVFMSFIRLVEPLIRTKRPVYMLFIFYAFIYFAVMLPSKFWALATINDGKWGTR